MTGDGDYCDGGIGLVIGNYSGAADEDDVPPH